MTNIQQLKKLLTNLEDGEFRDECLECLEAVESDIDDLETDYKDQIQTLESELDEANTEIDNLKDTEPDYDNTVELGLDTIHYKLESGNLKVSQQLESAFNLIKS